MTLYLEHVREALQAENIETAKRHIDFFCGLSNGAARAWSLCRGHCSTLEDYRSAAFQLSEICHEWGYTFDRNELKREFGDALVGLVDRMALRPGDLTSHNPEHFLMNNPIWRRPFILRGVDEVLLPLPHIIYSFPFQMFEELIANNSVLNIAYSEARAEFLEEAVRSHVASAMPSARVYHKVLWRDDDGTLYENDIVTILGNTIFLFEAKSGRVHEAARRGAELKLVHNLKELFVEPAKQAARLEQYLNQKGRDARLWIKDTNEPVHLDLSKPKVVHKFGVCIEHFAALTSARHNLAVLGAIVPDEPWAPVLTLGELMMLWRYLDTEVSFFHYLTRRATLDEVLDFEGDEQDVLSHI